MIRFNKVQESKKKTFCESFSISSDGMTVSWDNMVDDYLCGSLSEEFELLDPKGNVVEDPVGEASKFEEPFVEGLISYQATKNMDKKGYKARNISNGRLTDVYNAVEWDYDLASETASEDMQMLIDQTDEDLRSVNSLGSLVRIDQSVYAGKSTNLAIEDVARVIDSISDILRAHDSCDGFVVNDDKSVDIWHYHVENVIEADVAVEYDLFRKDKRIQNLLNEIADMDEGIELTFDVAKKLIAKHLPCYNTRFLDYCQLPMIITDYLEAGSDVDDLMSEFEYQISADPDYSLLDMYYLGYSRN